MYTPRDEPAGTGTILDDDRCVQRPRQIRRQHAGIGVVSSTRAESHDQPHGLAGEESRLGFLGGGGDCVRREGKRYARGGAPPGQRGESRH
jgi:hypothetical protein